MYRNYLVVMLMLGLLSTSIGAQLPLYDLPEPFANPVSTSGSLAITRAGRFVVANTLADSVAIVGLNRELETEIDVGEDPRGVTITPNNLQVLSVSRLGGSLSVIDLESGMETATYPVGEEPYHVVADEGFAYVSLRSEDVIAEVDLETGRVTARIETPPTPSALALWGDFLYVTHFWSGQFSLIYLPTYEVVRTIQLHADATLLQAIEIDPFSGRAFLPASQRDQDEARSDMDSALLPMLYIVDLGTMRVTERINLAADDSNVSMPFAVAQPQNRSRVYVAHAGSDNVTVLNLDTGTADTSFDVGANPRAIVFNRQSTRLVTHNVVDQTVSVVGTGFFDLQDSPPTTAEPFTAQQQIGLRLFHTARDERLSSGLLNCAACHFDGDSDRQMWMEAATPVFDTSTNFSAGELNEHIAAFQGGLGLELDGLDMQALLQIVRP